MEMAKRTGVFMLFRDSQGPMEFARKARSVCLEESQWLGFDFVDIIEGQPIVWSPVDLAVPFVYAHSPQAAESLAERVKREAPSLYSRICLLAPVSSRFLSVPLDSSHTVRNLHLPLHAPTLGQDARRFVYETVEGAFTRWLIECCNEKEENADMVATFLRSSTSDTERRRLQRWCERNKLPSVGKIRRIVRLGLAL